MKISSRCPPFTSMTILCFVLYITTQFGILIFIYNSNYNYRRKKDIIIKWWLYNIWSTWVSKSTSNTSCAQRNHKDKLNRNDNLKHSANEIISKIRTDT